MLIEMLRLKLHRVRITETHLEYEGSCAIDRQLLAISGLKPFEKIAIYNVNNGERFETYAIEAPEDSGTISLNGAAARKGQAGDIIIIAAFTWLSLEEAAAHQPRLVYVDEKNRPIATQA
jgi:aspartate 1-decarboxylase